MRPQIWRTVQMKTIDLCIISGFFGSGKTTLLQNILNECSGVKAGVLVNEFGKVSIDGALLKTKGMDMVELTNGSIFCACKKGDFIQTLIDFSKKDIDILFVENSGLADPSEMPSILSQLDAKFERKYKYNGSTCVIDCSSFLVIVETLLAAENQTATASRIILNKTDLISLDDLRKVYEKVRSINTTADIFETTYGKIPAETLMRHQSAPIAERECSNTVDKRPGSLVITAKGTFDPEKLKELAAKAGEISYRIKGFAPTESGWAQVEYSGITAEVYPTEKDPDVDCLTIVFITKKMFALKTIKSLWEEIMGTPACFDLPAQPKAE